jgi:hypothetical protein
MNLHTARRQPERRDYLLDGGADVRGLIDALVEATGGSSNTVLREAAEAAHAAGRAAWWICIGGWPMPNASLGELVEDANNKGLGLALRLHSDPTYPSAARHPAYLASMLVPLNREAREEYSRVMMRIAGGLK